MFENTTLLRGVSGAADATIGVLRVPAPQYGAGGEEEILVDVEVGDRVIQIYSRLQDLEEFARSLEQMVEALVERAEAKVEAA